MRQRMQSGIVRTVPLDEGNFFGPFGAPAYTFSLNFDLGLEKPPIATSVELSSYLEILVLWRVEQVSLGLAKDPPLERTTPAQPNLPCETLAALSCAQQTLALGTFLFGTACMTKTFPGAVAVSARTTCPTQSK